MNRDQQHRTTKAKKPFICPRNAAPTLDDRSTQWNGEMLNMDNRPPNQYATLNRKRDHTIYTPKGEKHTTRRNKCPHPGQTKWSQKGDSVPRENTANKSATQSGTTSLLSRNLMLRVKPPIRKRAKEKGKRQAVQPVENQTNQPKHKVREKANKYTQVGRKPSY